MGNSFTLDVKLACSEVVQGQGQEVMYIHTWIHTQGTGPYVFLFFTQAGIVWMEDVESLSASALAIPLPQPAISVVMNGSRV